MADLLTETEMHRWQLWKRATDTVWEQVARAVATASALSSADFAVLTRTVEAATPPRQQDIADRLGWSRSRLSRQLSRMEERGLVRRAAGPTATTIEATEFGRRVAAKARLAHADAVRAVLLSRPPEGLAEQFWQVAKMLGEPVTSTCPP